MLTALRETVRTVLSETPARRKPTLRRSDSPEALLATDLPLVADDPAVEGFIRRMAALGWRVWPVGDWLLLDADVPEPACRVPAYLHGELGCCVSLLRRHPGGETDQEVIRALVKAAESGAPALEKLCARLHAEWAAALREHRNLPGGLLPYLCRAAISFELEGGCLS